MSKFTVIAPRRMWEEILHCLEPVPRPMNISFRELRSDEVQKYPPDIDTDIENPIYLVGIQHAATATAADIQLFENRLQTKWSYVRAEMEQPLWCIPTQYDNMSHQQNMKG
ncbi:hypothetical protein K2P47_02655 [Patescibacteria group bacterium]|nr:hypothetical protein [Patescibacteria group bacterium]